MAITHDVDEVLRSLGKYGRFQIFQYVYNQICLLPVVFPVLIFVFIGNIPNFRCRDISIITWNGEEISTNSSDVQIQYHKCDVTVQVNQSNTVGVSQLSCVNGYDYEGPETVVTEWNLVCNREGLGAMSTTMVMVGQTLGASLFTPMADKYGRKVMVYTTFISMTVCTLLGAIVPWFAVFVILRFLIGAFQQGFGLSLAALCIELFPAECRGPMIYITCIVWSLSISSIPLLTYFLRNVSWRYTMLAAGLTGFHCIGTRWILEESPRWLVANNKTKELRAWISRAAKCNGKKPSAILELSNVNSSLNAVKSLIGGGDDELQNSKDHTTNETYTFLEIFRKRHILLTSMIVWIVWFVNSLTYYGIFLTSGTMTGNRFLNFFINGVIEIPSLFVCMYTANRFGRKKTCAVFHAIAGISLVLSAILLTLRDRTSLIDGFSAFFNFMGKFGISGSFATIFLYTPEIYPTNLRSAGYGMASAAARIGGMLSPFTTMFAAWIQWGPGVVFGSLSIVVCILFLWLPETSGRELPTNLEDLTDFYVIKGKQPKK
ncbi:solute carrier family 22 member 21-like [Saccostrea echinata]|uniref:solute carrier family 22 member 21-like n=1 Tax=Saccostrea echinata TaxID=191078 RepID=UPI002A82FD89|nr:solute carrier family 22 member 21-like [Saccostrea echinata]